MTLRTGPSGPNFLHWFASGGTGTPIASSTVSPDLLDNVPVNMLAGKSYLVDASVCIQQIVTEGGTAEVSVEGQDGAGDWQNLPDGDSGTQSSSLYLDNLNVVSIRRHIKVRPTIDIVAVRVLCSGPSSICQSSACSILVMEIFE